MKHKIVLPIVLALSIMTFISCVQEEHPKKVTFRVDMGNSDNLSKVGIRGQFTSPSWEVTIPMLDEDKDGIFEVTLEEKTAQSSVAFKFVVDNDQFELQCQPNRTIQFAYEPEEIIYTAVWDENDGEQQKLYR